jgi:outer membrane protein assembly factor BamB
MGGSRHGFNGAPVVDGDFLYVEVGSPKGAGMVCFRKATGAVVWKSQNDMAGYGPPIIATICGIKQLVCFTVEGGVGLNLTDGALLWRVPLSTAFGRHVMQPIVSGDLVVVASHEVGMVATRIIKQGTGLATQPLWAKKELGINFSSPVAIGDHLYGLGLHKDVMCVELMTGKVAWDQDGCINSSADKAFAAFIALGPNLLMLNDTGELILFGSDASQFTQIGRVQVCGANWCGPAYADGKLYVRDRKELRCVDLLAH